jgi:peptidoglycan/LPS O-acetylase OafA/YrhL
MSARAKSGYLPTLDGWRCLAIVGVILFHDQLRRVGPISTSVPHQLGYLGVPLFFGISGLLITSRLLEEERATGTFSLRGFYTRRAFRIIPPLLAFLASLVLLHVLFGVPLTYQGVWAALLFVRNYTGSVGKPLADWFTGHCWSLSIEEQFYLALPLTLLLGKSRVRMGIALGIAGIALFGWTAFLAPHFLANFYWPNAPYWQSRSNWTELHLHGLILGCSLALMASQPAYRKVLHRWIRPSVAVGLASILVAAYYLLRQQHGHAAALCLQALQPLFPFLVLSTVMYERSFISRFLELAPLRYVGRLSYSLYLWQQLFFLDAYIWPHPLLWMNRFPLSYVLAFACALTSFHLIERPMMRWGHKLAPPPSPGHADLQLGMPQSVPA